jgi:hypothetical protein
MNIYLLEELRKLVNSAGSTTADKPSLFYQDQPYWWFNIINLIDSVVTPVNVTDAVAWQFAVDSDFNAATTPMCRTLNADIDKSQLAAGKVGVPVDGTRAEYLAALGTKQSIPGYAELKGFNSAGRRIYYFQFGLTLGNIVDPDGATPLPVPDNLITEAQLAAILTGKLDKVSAEDIELTGTAGIILADRTTGIRYRFYLDNGQFIKEDI